MISGRPTLAIRPFTSDDYEFLAAVHNAVYQDSPRSVAQWRHDDATRDRALLLVRHVIEVGRRPVACGYFGHSPWIDDPDKYWVQILVLPEVRDERIRSEYLELALASLQSRDPFAVYSGMVENHVEHIRFLEANGFQEVHREHTSRLELESYDPSVFTAAVARVVGQGIRLAHLPDLQYEFEDWRERLHLVYQQLVADQPAPDPPRLDTLEEWESSVLGSPDFEAALWIVAMDGDRMIGISQAAQSLEDPSFADCGLTGVLAAYRRRGVATALKAELLAFAKRAGIKRIATSNEENNPMFTINVGLGFEPQPDWVMYERRL